MGFGLIATVRFRKILEVSEELGPLAGLYVTTRLKFSSTWRRVVGEARRQHCVTVAVK
jgi:hypothetical protein